MIAERIAYLGASSVLRARVAVLRPRYRPCDPADRTTYVAGEIVQCDLWFPAAVVPVGAGQLLAPPVLTMVSAFSRWVMATALPSRTTGDLIAGMWLLIQTLGAVPKKLVWDNEAGIGAHQRLTMGARSFAGTLGTRIWQAPARVWVPETMHRPVVLPILGRPTTCTPKADGTGQRGSAAAPGSVTPPC